MEEKYKIFPEAYSKMLDLVEIADEEIANKYKSFISKLPSSALNKLKGKKDYYCEGTDFRIDMASFQEMIELQYTTFRKYLNITVNVYPYLVDDLFACDAFDIDVDPDIDEDENGDLFIFSISFTNTNKEPQIKINYKEKDGKYEYKNTQMDGMEFDFSVFIKKCDDDFYLVSERRLNDVIISQKETPISYEELEECAMTEIEDGYDEQDSYEIN